MERTAGNSATGQNKFSSINWLLITISLGVRDMAQIKIRPAERRRLWFLWIGEGLRQNAPLMCF